MSAHGRDAPPWIVVTDLDGTLLDHHTYSWRAAAPALERLRRLGIPVVLNSSKTRVEMASLRRDLDNWHPFVSENGAVAHVPTGYFERLASGQAIEKDVASSRHVFGPTHRVVLEILHGLRQQHGFRFEGFSDWTPQEIQQHTGLDLDGADEAAQRDGGEPILWLDERSPDVLAEALAPHGLQLQAGGRFLHVMGRTDKGHAMEWLMERYRRVWPQVGVVALGDSPNDMSMLRRADHAVILPRVQGDALDIGPHGSVRRPSAAGPEGWNHAILELLDAALGDDKTEPGETKHG